MSVHERFRLIGLWSLHDPAAFDLWCARHPGATSYEVAAQAMRALTDCGVKDICGTGTQAADTAA